MNAVNNFDIHSNTEAAAKHLKAKCGVTFNALAGLQQALTHPSLDGVPNYQRMEFLGDRVLGLTVSDSLFHHFEGQREGKLARALNDLVRKETLAEIALELDLGQYILMSGALEDDGGRDQPAILADVMEAVLGAIYLDQGFDVAKQVILNLWGDRMFDVKGRKDPKSALQEYLQGQGEPLPTYSLVGQSGPDHAPIFQVEVATTKGETALGEGPSKRIAETAAADALLRSLQGKLGKPV